MRLFPVVKPGMMHHAKNSKIKNRKTAGTFALVSLFSLAPVLLSAPAFAQSYVSSVPPLTPAAGRQMYGSPYGTAGYGYGSPAMYGGQQYGQQGGQQQSSTSPVKSFGFSNSDSGSGSGSSSGSSGSTPSSSLSSMMDTESRAKADQLAEHAERQRALEGTLDQQTPDTSAALDEQAPPPDLSGLQQVNKSNPSTAGALADDPVSKGLSLDMRKNAQKEAALSYGARGGLAKRNFEIMERMKGFEAVLDKVFDFRALLIKAPSGMLIEPPIIKESDRAVVVTQSGDEAAVADKVFDINQKAKIVTAPRDWRQYLIQSWTQVPPPPRILWPKNQKEQAEWDSWIEQGWDAGVEQADQIFEANVNQLVADYNGMVRYKMLLAQDMITAPYAMHEDRGVQADANQMRVGDRALRITGPSQFTTRADLWKPASQ